MSGLLLGASLAVAPASYAQAPAEMPAPMPAPAEGAPPAPAAPTSPEVEQRLRELEETVRRQSELIKRLEQTVEELRKPAPPSPPPAEPPKPARADGFTVPGREDGTRLRLRGLLHTDARIFPSEGGRTGSESFLSRRIRTIFSGQVDRWAEFQIQPIFDENRLSVLDAYVDVRRTPELQLRAGLFKTPFSLERLQSASDLLFIERSIAQNLAPNRDTGFMVHGDTLKGRFSYAAAVLNGAPDGGNVYGDPGRDKDFAGRIFARPFLDQKGSFLEGLGVGLAATYGHRDEPFAVTYRTDAREPFFVYQPGTTYDGTVRRLAPQFYHYYRQLGLMGEAYLNRETVGRNGVVRAFNNRGWFLQGSYVLTGENAGFRSVVPRRPFDPSRGQWGALEVALRYSDLRIDPDAFRLGFADPLTSARRATSWTFGLNWYLTTALKLQVNYERTHFNGPILFRTGPHDREELILTRLQLSY
ncbi:MAG: OprO/OprP family phosphate-selective porin [Armatimonadota bacterium]